MLMLALAASSGQAAERITTQLFDEGGTRIGMATEVGKTTTFYDVDGNKTGSMKIEGGKPVYYDARGRRGSPKPRAPR